MKLSRALFLVQCVAKKRPRPARARDLYLSPWFVKARAYVESQPRARWLILSAKHGALPPMRRIRPYNVTLVGKSRARCHSWAERVLSQLRQHCRRGDDIVLLAGERYRRDIAPRLKDWGCKVHIPLKGRAIGQQMAWLKKRTRA